MSRRRIEAGVNAGSSFSLRAMTDQPVAPTLGFAAPTRKPISPPAIPSIAGLSFKFAGPVGATNTATPVRSTAAMSVPPAIPSAMANPFASIQANSQRGPEVMRLTAAADDMRQRLRVATDRSAQLESQLQRAQQQLQRERHDAQQQIGAVRAEVASVRDSELKLRSELAQRPTVTEFKQNKFHDAVRTAMEAEEMSARVADSEARIVTLTKRAEALNAEVALLEKTRADAIEVTSANSKAMFTEAELAEKLAAIADAESRIATAEERLSVLADDIAKHEALRDSNKTDAHKAELELVTANEALVAAVADLTATKQERGEAILKVAELKEELKGLEVDISASNEKAVGGESPAPSWHAMVVTGEMPPNNELGFPTASTMRTVDAMGCSGCGLPYHFNIDAPISIGALSEPQGNTPVDEMVKAIVADLKGYFKFSAEENAKRGIAPVAPTGSSTGQQIAVM